MNEYTAPTRDMGFLIREVLDLEAIAALPGFEEASPDVVTAVLDEAGRFAGGVLAPINPVGDSQGAVLQEGRVRVPEGFASAYREFVDGGWNGVSASPEYGGMGLPELVATATQEMWQSACFAFALCPMLTAGAIEAVSRHGSPEQKARYLEKMVTGQWTGTMDLTEPQAGSDLAAIRTRAVPEGDHYRLFGQKIYITYGEHEMTENIVHHVLARTPDAPPGVKGISLFIVPKYLPNDDGTPGERNDMHCASLEHKLGIHASPTCAMIYGDSDGAVGYLIGEEGRGLEYMFTMMNEARHKVGVQGLSIAERAYQQALAYARERVQGRPVGRSREEGAAIIEHPDVRRMLLSMKARTEAMRALCYVAAAEMDRARRQPADDARKAAQSRVDLLIPVVKAWCTELGVDVASMGIQVHGGMGYIEETGAAQHLRDARIAPIYEGTNGIQANDLVGRKVLRDGGRAVAELVADMGATAEALNAAKSDAVRRIEAPLREGIQCLQSATDWVLSQAEAPEHAMANSMNYLMLAGYVTGGWMMARSALAAQEALDTGAADPAFYQAKLVTAGYYADQILPGAVSLARAVTAGAEPILAMPAEQF
ncbi:MAG: acyl-CoA dehydrogenase [Ectothiorhodospiraceae bacterium]|jgi:acyl-CoA dehydrogenase